MINLLYILLFLNASSMDTAKDTSIDIEVKNLNETSGKIYLAVYDKPDNFLDRENIFLTDSLPANLKKINFKIKNIKQGKYAFVVIHDKNSNNKLDYNFLGMPSEPYGFSKNPKLYFGPPNFDDVAIDIEDNSRIEINLK